MRSLFLASVLFGARAAAAGAAPPDEAGPSALWQSLLELRTTASALHITAHPDDEDGPVLTYLSRGLGARTLLLTVNRGEGGADLIAPHSLDALGVLRTLEMLEAARRYGAEPFFTRLADYGYSKSFEEALSKWGEEDILRDAVRLVRRERPEVILSRFRGDAREGHATTYVVNLMARRAFEAAADPSVFPEQLGEGLHPWAPKKLYVHNLRPDGEPQLPDLSTVVVRAGDYDPIRGRSYFETARKGYYLHRTQGTFDRLSRSGPFDVHYQLVRTTLPAYSPKREASFFDGLDTSLAGIAAAAGATPPAWLRQGLTEMNRAVDAAFAAFDPRQPERAVEPLLAGLEATRALLARASGLEEAARDPIDFHLRRKEVQLEQAVAHALSLDFEASVEADTIPAGPATAFRTAFTFNHAVPGETFGARLRLVNRSPVPILPTAARLELPDGWVSRADATLPVALSYNESFTARFRVRVPDGAEPTRPYWHRDSIEQAVYTIRDARYATNPFPPAPAWGAAVFSVGGTDIRIRTPLRVIRPDPPGPALRPPLTVVPAIGVRFTSERGVVRQGRSDYSVSVVVHSSVKGPAAGDVRLGLPAGWTSTPPSSSFSFAREDEEAAFTFRVSIKHPLDGKGERLTAVARYRDRDYAEGYRTITAPDLGRFNLYEPARHRLRGVAVEVPEDLRVGYVMGVRDSVPEALAQIEVGTVLLDAADLAGADLHRFDAIVLGIRAYTVRPDVRTANGRLLEYVREGGVLIVQYQTPEFDHDYGPYPYSMTGAPEEVTQEDSRMEILAPRNPLFTAPNRITLADFDDWTFERGSKFLASWDDRYTPLVETHDREQRPQRGGWLYAPYGRGVYIYCAYAFHRQLPHGVPGAFRLYANMLALRRTLTARRAPR